jgi:hypothetical protein
MSNCQGYLFYIPDLKNIVNKLSNAPKPDDMGSTPSAYWDCQPTVTTKSMAERDVDAPFNGPGAGEH